MGDKDRQGQNHRDTGMKRTKNGEERTQQTQKNVPDMRHTDAHR